MIFLLLLLSFSSFVCADTVMAHRTVSNSPTFGKWLRQNKEYLNPTGYYIGGGAASSVCFALCIKPLLKATQQMSSAKKEMIEHPSLSNQKRYHALVRKISALAAVAIASGALSAGFGIYGIQGARVLANAYRINHYASMVGSLSPKIGHTPDW